MDKDLHGCIAELRHWAINGSEQQQAILTQAIRDMADIIAEDMPEPETETMLQDTTDFDYVLKTIVIPFFFSNFTDKTLVTLKEAVDSEHGNAPYFYLAEKEGEVWEPFYDHSCNDLWDMMVNLATSVMENY